jgi:hypothetical protein
VTPLGTDDLRRFAAIMERALGSSFDGERLAALSRAQSLLKAHDPRVTELLGVVPAVATPAPMRGWHDVVHDLQRYPLTEWEVEFAASILGWSGLSAKQEAVLRRMCTKYSVRPWMADAA